MSGEYVDLDISTDSQAGLASFITLIQQTFPDYEPSAANLEWWVVQWMAQEVIDLAELAKTVGAKAFRAFGEKILGVPIISATSATTTATVTMTDNAGHYIPAGAQMSLLVGDDSYGFVTTADLTVLAGSTSGSVPVRAALEGSDVNLLTGDVEMIDAYNFVSSVVFDDPPSGGVDDESEGDYLGRLAETTRLLTPRPILASEVATYVRKVAGVDRATAIDNLDPGTNEVQRISVTGSPSSGGSTLTYSGQTTASIAYNSTAANVKSKLVALSNIGPADIIASGGPLPATPIDIEFVGNLGGQNVAQMTVTDSITGGDMTVTTTTAGVASDDTTEKAITVYPVDADGLPVSDEIKATVLAELEAVSEINFLYFVRDPNYNSVDVGYVAVPKRGYTDEQMIAACDGQLADYLSPADWGRTQFERWENLPTIYVNEIVSLLDRLDPVERVVSVQLALSGDTLTAADLDLVGPVALPIAGTISGATS